MKAMVVTAPGEINYIDVEKPVPGPYEVVTRVVYCGICGTDAEIYYGDTSMAKTGQFYYPVRIGHEWSGIVESVGSEVKNFKPGDRVISDTGSSCGHCEACLSGDFLKCNEISSLGTVWNCKPGAFAEYIVMHHWHLHKLPDSISLDEATLIEPATNALHALEISGVKPGDTVMIAGTGAIGMMALVVAKQMDLRVFVAGRKPFKLDVALQLGAEAVVNTTTDSMKDFVAQHTGGTGVNLFFDTTGASAIIAQALDCLAYNGALEMAAFYENTLDNLDLNRLVIGQQRLMGSEGTGWSAGRFVDMLAQRGWYVRPIITQKVAFQDAADTLRNYRKNTDKKIKTLVQISSEN